MMQFADFSQSNVTQELTHLIQHTIKEQGGIISFAKYMELALYTPFLGYYQTKAFHPVQGGDFITAPEISPLFAQCFAATCHPLLTQLNAHIIEIGAGSGRFAADLLLALEKQGSLINYTIYEISAWLRGQQQLYLQTACPHLCDRIRWVEKLPPDLTGIIIANEVFDALPTHCFRIDHQQQIFERGVSYQQGKFMWQLREPTMNLAREISLLHERHQLSFDYESELNLAYEDFICELQQALKQGIIFLIDYGYGQNEYYHPARKRGTLSCFYQHHYHDNPFLLPGSQDITSHVDFTRIIDIAYDHDFELTLYTHQAAFLLSAGIMKIAEELEKTLSTKEALSLHQAIKLLTFPTEMGERIKIMVLSKGMQESSLTNFNPVDRRRDLYVET